MCDGYREQIKRAKSTDKEGLLFLEAGSVPTYLYPARLKMQKAEKEWRDKIFPIGCHQISEMGFVSPII